MSAYRKAMPYRKPPLYRGAPAAVSSFGNASTFRFPTDAVNDHSAPVSLLLHDSFRRDFLTEFLFDSIAAENKSVRVPMQSPGPHSFHVVAPCDLFSEFCFQKIAPFEFPTEHSNVRAFLYAEYDGKLVDRTSLPYVTNPVARNVAAALPWGMARAHGSAVALFWHQIAARGAVVALPWSPISARQNSSQIHWPAEPGEFGDPLIVAKLPVYFMIPSISVVRLPDRTPIDAINVSVSSDENSWAWTFSALIPHAQLALVDPSAAGDPTDIEININGYVWNLRVKAFSDNRKFGSRTVTITGTSLSSELAQPEAPVRTYTEMTLKNAAQIADAELVGTGWTCVWDAVDWAVPAEGFSYQDLAPIEVINRLAESIGAKVQTDMEAKTIHVTPSYEDSPWVWGAATPYAILPANIITAASGSWQGGTNADGVYVYAQNDAFGALVKITGTAGANELPMIVDPLLVSADPARERGRIELARAGKIKTETITIPLFPSPASPGLIPVGKLLEIEETESVTWRALMKAVRIDANRSGKATSVRQTLTIERQYR